MPRATNSFDGPEGDELDAARAEYDVVEATANRARVRLRAAILRALAAKMSVNEAARRSGYTREYVSRMQSAAQKEAARIEAEAPVRRAVKRAKKP